MNVAQPVVIFLESCILGFFLGILYDIFRIIRLSFPHGNILVFVEDLLYCLLVTIVSFTFILMQNDGVLRTFLILGELLGAVLYFFTLSVIVMKTAHWIIKMVRAFFKLIYRVLIRPLFLLFRSIGRLFQKIGQIFHKNFEKLGSNCKKHLKQRKGVVYNKINSSDDSTYLTP